MSRIKKQWRKNRQAFKNDLIRIMGTATAMAICKTWEAHRHRKHIGEIWLMLRKHPEANQEYIDRLFGKHLAGEDSIFTTLNWINPSVAQKHRGKIPNMMAMGDAYGIAKRYLICNPPNKKLDFPQLLEEIFLGIVGSMANKNEDKSEKRKKKKSRQGIGLYSYSQTRSCGH